MRRSALALGALALLSGCVTWVGRYDPRSFEPRRIAPDKKIPGRALVLTTPADDAYVYSGRPTTKFGGVASTLRLPLGVIAREGALRVFGDLFAGGAEASNDPSRAAGLRAVIAPRVERFSYGYPLVGAPRCWLSVEVTLRDARGRVALERTYEVGPIEATNTPGREQDSPGERIASAAHVAVQQAMLRAAAEVKAVLEAETRRAP